MKSFPYISCFLLSILTLNLNAQIDIKLQSIIKNPPSVSEGPNKSFKIPEKGGVLIDAQEFISYIEVLARDGDYGQKYKFRTYSKIFKLEVSGEGRVFWRYYEIADPTQKGQKTITTLDMGSNLYIEAGLFKIEWSLGSYLYYEPSRVTITEGGRVDYALKIQNGG